MRLHEAPPLKKEIISSRIFGHRVYRLEALREAMVTYATRAAEKLREQGSLCSTLLVSVQAGQHEPEERHYYRSLGIQLAHPTDDTRILLQAALAGLDPSIARVTANRVHRGAGQHCADRPVPAGPLRPGRAGAAQ